MILSLFDSAPTYSSAIVAKSVHLTSPGMFFSKIPKRAQMGRSAARWAVDLYGHGFYGSKLSGSGGCLGIHVRQQDEC